MTFAHLKEHVRWAAAASLMGVLLIVAAVLPVGSQEGQQPPTISRDDEQTCLACHASAIEGLRAVDRTVLDRSPHAAFKCQDCHSSITAAPHTPEMLKVKASCGTCHTEPAEGLAVSVHSRPDKVEGDHPTCISCHAKGGDPHAVVKADWNRKQVTALCSGCHRQQATMGRYGVDPDAVRSYQRSFHGKALLRFGMDRAAGCADCHRVHDVRSPQDPESPTHRNNAAANCGQAGCHPGAKMNFAMSGANHLTLKMKDYPFLRLEELFFQVLTVGTMTFLMGGIALDLRKRVFTRQAVPLGSRLVAIFVAMSFIALVAALAMALLGFGRPRWTGIAAVILLVVAFVVYMVTPKPARPAEKEYPRFDLNQRLQHIALFVSFILLAVTGMPLRFADHPWMQAFYMAMGGLTVARAVHRVAAVVMIGTWIWHSIDLIIRWKRAGFSTASWTMLPRKKDLQDFWQLSKYYLGFAQEPPKFDRFEFRQKFDYFAVYWGMPIMVFSGLVLWFPVYLGNILPEAAVSAAYIAHSDEAILAVLAIAVWHFYNVHFNPGDFPMSKSWLTGKKTRSQMEHEHPLELERLEGQQ